MRTALLRSVLLLLLVSLRARRGGGAARGRAPGVPLAGQPLVRR